MKNLKYLGLIGTIGLLALLFWVTAPGASAQDDAAIELSPSSTAAEVGDVEITISGSGFADSGRVYVVVCPGAEGDPDFVVSSGNATTACTNVIGAFGGTSDLGVFTPTNGIFSESTTVSITQEDIDNGGLYILVGTVSSLTGPSAGAVLSIEDSSADTDTDSSGDADAEEEEMDDDEEMDDEEMDDESTGLADTGVESGLLAVAGISVVIAGLLFAGLSRRIRK